MFSNWMVRTTFLSLSILAALTFAPGCSNSDPATADVRGTWVITQNFSTGTVNTIEAVLTQSGQNITGTSANRPITGTVRGTKIDFVVTGEDVKTFTGTVAGDSMGGTFDENFENSLFREGTWTGVRM